MFCLLPLVTLGADEHDHSFAFEVRHIVGFTEIGKVGSKTCEEQFALLFEHDGASAEEDVGFDFVAFLKELLSVFELEVVVMIVGLRTETNLLHLLLFLVSLSFFLFLFLRVQELLVVNDAADRRRSRRSDLDEVEVLLIGNMHCLLEGVDAGLYIVANKAHLEDTADFVIDTMRVFFDNTTATRSGSNSCYCFNFLVLIIHFSRRHTLPYNRKSAQNYNKFSIYARKNDFFSLFS